jgi:tetratricopeptide (TPR) repeat protein
MRIFLAGVVFFTSVSAFSVAHPDSLAIAADYYFSRHDYRQALQLWNEVFRRQPDNVTALLRVAELKLVFEGRSQATETVVKFLSQRGEGLEGSQRAKIKQNLQWIQEKFLTEEGQTLYLQALPKIQHDDCPGALTLLNQSTAVEKGALMALKQKANCEKKLKQFNRLYTTLQSAYETCPFDPFVTEELMDAHLFFRDYSAAAVVYKNDLDDVFSDRQRLSIIYSLMETGETPGAVRLLRAHLEAQKGSEISPPVLFALGKVYSQRKDTQSASAQYLEKFLARMTQPRPAVIEEYDPYHLSERIEEAQKILSTIKEEKAKDQS